MFLENFARDASDLSVRVPCQTKKKAQTQQDNLKIMFALFLHESFPSRAFDSRAHNHLFVWRH